MSSVRFGKKLRLFCRIFDFDVRDLASICGVSATTTNKWMNDISLPRNRSVDSTILAILDDFDDFERAQVWAAKANSRLNGLTPRDYLLKGGLFDVLDKLGKI